MIKILKIVTKRGKHRNIDVELRRNFICSNPTRINEQIKNEKGSTDYGRIVQAKNFYTEIYRGYTKNRFSIIKLSIDCTRTCQPTFSFNRLQGLRYIFYTFPITPLSSLHLPTKIPFDPGYPTSMKIFNQKTQ